MKNRIRVRFKHDGICSTGKVLRGGCRWLPVPEANLLIGARFAVLAMDDFAASTPPGGEPEGDGDE